VNLSTAILSNDKIFFLLIRFSPQILRVTQTLPLKKSLYICNPLHQNQVQTLLR